MEDEQTVRFVNKKRYKLSWRIGWIEKKDKGEGRRRMVAKKGSEPCLNHISH